MLRQQLNDRIVAAERDGVAQPLSETRRAYLGMQSRIITDYTNQCTQSVSKVSKRGAKINEWFERRAYDERIKQMPECEQLWMGVGEPLMDPTMTTFGNMMARRMLRLEASLFVTALQSLILTLSIGSLDAYRHAFNLHYHVLLTGPNSTGKSFALEKVRDLRILDTVCKVDSGTKNADNVDVDLNDQIDYCEEVKPAGYRTKEMGGDDEEEASQKEFLTSMYRVRKVFTKELNGRRNQRVSCSQQITCKLNATNLRANQVSAAMRSRHSIFPVEERVRKGRVTSHLSGIESRLGVDARARLATFHDEMSIEQFVHYHANKLIASRALTEPTLGAFDAVNQIISDYLAQRHNIKLHPRTVERARILCRSMTISLAAEYLYSSPHSRFYRQPFDYMSLRELDPLMHDTAEIAFCAFDGVRHEILDDRTPFIVGLMRRSIVEPAIEHVLSDSHLTDAQVGTIGAPAAIVDCSLVDAQRCAPST